MIAALIGPLLVGCATPGDGAPQASAEIARAPSAAASAPSVSSSAGLAPPRPPRPPPTSWAQPANGPVKAASPAEVETFVRRLAYERGVPNDQIDDVVRAFPSGSEDPAISARVAEHAPFVSIVNHELFLADANNDGQQDWIVQYQNPLSDHRSGIEAVYTEDVTGKLVELPFGKTLSDSLFGGKDLGPAGPMYTDHPFVIVEKGRTMLCFRDTYPVNARGEVVGPMDRRVKIADKRYVYEWSASTVRLVRTVDKTVAVKPYPGVTAISPQR